jgi:Na+/H+ antiporter NhaD/arsenite permease-like protein
MRFRVYFLSFFLLLSIISMAPGFAQTPAKFTINGYVKDEASGEALIGSAIVDNVPLVAASMGMYSMETYPMDDMIWEYLAYCAGTGGSLLVIGSAAGVAAMGMEKIDFIWYLKRISFLAGIGYFAGAIVYLAFFTID